MGNQKKAAIVYAATAYAFMVNTSFILELVTDY